MKAFKLIFSLLLSVSVTFIYAQEPVNDNCESAIELVLGSACVMQEFTSIGATTQPDSIAGNPSCGNYQGGDVWFTFEVPVSGNFRVEMTSSGNNSQWELYSGTCGAFESIWCGTNAGNLIRNFSEPDLAGETLYIRSWRWNSTDGIDFSLCVSETFPPANDFCADAIALSVGQECVMQDFTSIFAGEETDSVAPNPSCGIFQGGDVWFTFEVPASGNFRIEMTSSGIDSKWALYSGTCGQMEQIRCANSGDELNTNFSEPSLAGETLYLRSWRRNSSLGIDFSLCVYEITLPANNDCSNAIVLNVGEECEVENYSTFFATASAEGVAPSPGCGFYYGGDVWFTFEVPVSGNFRVEIASLSAGSGIWSMYSGSCGNFEQLHCSGENVNFTEPDWAGETLFLRVHRYASSQGIDFSLCVFEIEPPLNNLCADAIPLPVGEIGSVCEPQEFSTLHATAEPTTVAPNPSCGFFYGGDVWFTFDVPASGNFRVEIASLSAGSGIWSIYSGSCGNFEQLFCSADNVNFTEPDWGGETFYLRVHRYANPQGVDFSLCIFETNPPTNNLCVDAIPLSVGAIGSTCQMQEFSTFDATAEPATVAPNPNCGFYYGGDVWFTFDVPESGNFRIEVEAYSAGDAIWSIYSGSCGDFSQLFCSGNDVNFTEPGWGGETFYIRVHRYASPQGVDFGLCIYETDPPVNNHCDNPLMLPVSDFCNPQIHSTFFSTAEAVEVAPDAPCGFYQGADVWFNMIVPPSGDFRIELTDQSSGNTYWTLYEGSCGAFVPLHCGNGGTNFSEPGWVGDTLTLRVYRQNSIQGIDFGICIYDLDIPDNNDCEDAFELTLGEHCEMQFFSNEGATASLPGIAPDPTCGAYQGGDVWFKFPVPESGQFRIERNNYSGVNANWALYTGSCGDFVQIACSQLNSWQNYLHPELGGETIYMRVFNHNNADGGTFELCVWEVPQPENDLCADAIHLPVSGECQMETFSNAYTFEDEPMPTPSCGLYQGGDVWFTFVVPPSGQFQISRNSIEGVNSSIAVYSGTCGSFLELECVQLTDQINFNDETLAGDTLYLRVFGFNSAAGGTFELCITDTSVPENDHCSDAIALPVSTSCNFQQFSNYNSTEEPGAAENPSCGIYQGGDVWFSFVVPPSGKFLIQRNNLDGNIYYNLYSGTCGNFTELDCPANPEAASYDQPGWAGDTIYLRAYRFNNPFGGYFELCIVEGDCNGDFGGTAYLDNCNTCVGGETGLEPCEEDCNGVYGGSAYIDNCGDCVGGNTGNSACVADCNGDWGGTAFLDDCENCVGGETGEEACSNAEVTAAACADGIDNDGDGLIDCDDPDCQALNANLGCSTCFNDGLSFADEVIEYFNDCVNNTSTDPESALGVPDYTSSSSEHVSLGRGFIKLAFTNNTLINSGDSSADLYVFEVGPQVESSSIELRPLNETTENLLISEGIPDADGDGFYEFGGIGGSTADVDIDAFFNSLPANSVQFDAIKIVDAPGSCSTATPGADIDAVCALSSLDCAVGQPCDDGDATTENDTYNSACECVGTSIYECPELEADNGAACVENGLNGIVVDCACVIMDCNGDIGGTAYLDKCSDCVGGETGLEPCQQDCNGVFGGSAFIDECDDCVGGTTGLTACVEDCNGDFGGTAFIDACNECVGGNTGQIACGSDCGTPAPVVVSTFPAINFVAATLHNALNSGIATCDGISGGDVFYTFTADAINHYAITVNPIGGFDAVVQVTESCGGAEIACFNTSGAGEAEHGLLMELEPGDYLVRIHNTTGDAESAATGNFLFGVQQFPYASVQDNPNNFLYACNQSGFTPDDFVGATPQLTGWILDYQWLIGEVGGGVVNEWQRGEANYSTRISWLGMEYGSTYNVFVRVLIDHPEFGPIWTVYPGDYNNPNTPGASGCTISTASNVTPTELRPNYSPTNASGNDYSLCDIAIAYNVQGSENFRWRFDPDMDPNNGNEIFYTRGAGNPSIMLRWVNGLVPGSVYNVAVEVQVDGQWSGYSTVKPMSLGLPPNDLTIRAQYCNTTMAPNGVILSNSVCKADYYTFEFENTLTGALHTRSVSGYALLMSYLNPELTPGEYSVRVRVTQNGVAGDFGPACLITIDGSGMAQEGVAAQRSIETVGSATLFPNPNAGSEVRVQLDGLSEGNHDVNIVIYDIYGKQISSDAYGHEGAQLNRLVRFDGNLSSGVYMVQILVDGEQFRVERMVVR